MTTVSIAPNPILQFFNNNGAPNAGGSVLTQVGEVNYPTYQDSAGTIPLPNPIPLNSRGEISNASGVSCQLFLVPGFTYVFTLYDVNGNQLNQSTSNVSLLAASIPQDAQIANYTAVFADANGHLYHGSGGSSTFTIPSNASVPYQIGTTLTFVNMSGTMSISINADTLIAAVTGTTGTRTLALNGIATALKITSTSWIIAGQGIS